MIQAKKPLVSIITVCYNEKKIENTCKSIVGQTFEGYEWIVIDGGSIDETLSILEKYKNNITVLISEKDSGIYDAMNKGIKLARGEWLIFMNGGDCFFEKNSLEKVFLQKHDVEIIFADGINNVYNTKHPLPINKDGKIILHRFFCENSLCHQATFIKKNLFKRVGLYDTSYKIIADHVFNYVALKKFKATYKYMPEIVALIDLAGVSMLNRSKLDAELIRLRKKEYNFCIEFLIKINRLLDSVLKKHA